VHLRCGVSFAGLLLLACSCLVAGCGHDEGGATVKGKVTYKGRPVVEGSLSFIPQSMPTAYGRLQPDGSYALVNHRNSERIEPGAYVVVIVSGANRSLTAEGAQAQQELPVPVSVTNQATTPLKFDVVEGPNTIDIDLDKLPNEKKGRGN